MRSKFPTHAAPEEIHSGGCLCRVPGRGAGQVVPIFSVATVGLGLGAALFGKWINTHGPRKATLVGAAAWGSGLAVAGAGVGLHSLPVTYLGYGLIGGR